MRKSDYQVFSPLVNTDQKVVASTEWPRQILSNLRNYLLHTWLV